MALIASKSSSKEPTLPGAGSLIVNSMALYAIAFIFATTFHEVGHALAGVYMKLGPTLHDHWVDYAHRGTPREEMFVAIAGPLVSLAVGWIFFLVFRAQDEAPSLARLFLAWVAYHGLMRFFGDLAATPWVPELDVGRFADLWEWPPFQWIAFAAGGIGVITLGTALGRWILSLSPTPALIRWPGQRGALLLKLAVVPWLLATPILLGLAFPVSHPFFLITVPASGAMTVVAMGAGRADENVPSTGKGFPEGISGVSLALLVVAAAVARVVLRAGIGIGGGGD
jgi:hypothetical protein